MYHTTITIDVRSIQWSEKNDVTPLQHLFLLRLKLLIPLWRNYYNNPSAIFRWQTWYAIKSLKGGETTRNDFSNTQRGIVKLSQKVAEFSEETNWTTRKVEGWGRKKKKYGRRTVTHTRTVTCVLVHSERNQAQKRRFSNVYSVPLWMESAIWMAGVSARGRAHHCDGARSQIWSEISLNFLGNADVTSRVKFTIVEKRGRWEIFQEKKEEVLNCDATLLFNWIT